MSGTDVDIGRLMRRLSCSPWFSGLTAWIGACAGFLAAIYADRISHAFPFYNSYERDFVGYGSLDYHVALAYGTLILFGCMFGLNSWALTTAADLQIQELKTNTGDLKANTADLKANIADLQFNISALENVVRTMPRKDFLEGFQTYLTKSFPVAYKSAHPGCDAKDVRNGILALLSNLAYMAKLFDGRKGCEVRANIMVFRPFNNLPDHEIKAFAERANFTERRGTKGNDWSGVLELVPTLAVVLKGDEIIVDEKLVPAFVLEIPLPVDRIVNDQSAVLPGAPEAFCSKGYSYCPDTHLMGKMCRTDRALRHAVSEAMDQYFIHGNGQDIRSIMSVALNPAEHGASENLDPIGIVNIDCDLPDLLKSDEGVDMFVPLTTPHVLFLASLVEKFLTA